MVSQIPTLSLITQRTESNKRNYIPIFKAGDVEVSEFIPHTEHFEALCMCGLGSYHAFFLEEKNEICQESLFQM